MSDPLDSIPPAPGLDPRLGIGASVSPSSPAGASIQPITGLDSLGFVMDVPVQVTVEIGRKSMKIGEILRLGPGSVLELEKANGEPLDIYVNDRLIARGEAVVVGERYGVRLTEVLVGDEVVTGGL
ncbi:MAG: flagellar motor switch protein FliN [Polyangiaceae bacterium]|nr:flagellar motor switch protein FliN [Myxococcales bacterium]MCB9587305.1 flagellar motor switch protein FliN [Polyangiaceae bacterium]MCB9605898.1 flagellar motor switch protein FliN [Polyangiaceae bacterium]